MRKFHFIIWLTFLAGSTLSALTGAPETATKGAYVFLEATAAEADERYDDSYMLLRHAVAVDPGDVLLAGALADVEILLPDSSLRELSYRRLRDRFYFRPTDDAFANAFINAANDARRFDDLVTALKTLQKVRPDRITPTQLLASAYRVRAIQEHDSCYADSSLMILEQLSQSIGFNQDLLTNKVQILKMLGRTAEIDSLMSATENEAPDDPLVQVFLGRIYTALESADRGLLHIDKARALDSTVADIYPTAALIYAYKGDTVSYDRLVEEAVAMHSLPFETKMQLWGQYIEKYAQDSLRVDRIKHLFTVLEEDHPDEEPLHTLYGSYLMYIDDVEGGKEQFDYAVALDPDSREARDKRLQAYLQFSNTAEIEQVATDYLAHDPGNCDIAILRALSIAYQGRLDEAIAVADTCTPTSNASRHWASEIYAIWASTMGDSLPIDTIMTAFRKAIDLDAYNSVALNNAAYLLARRGVDLDLAELYASVAVTSDPQNTTFLDTYAWVFFNRKEYDKARRQIDEVLRLSGVVTDPDNPGGDDSGEEAEVPELSAEVFDHAGDIYYMTGEPDRAVEFWKEALNIDPENDLIRRKVQQKEYIAPE